MEERVKDCANNAKVRSAKRERRRNSSSSECWETILGNASSPFGLSLIWLATLVGPDIFGCGAVRFEVVRWNRNSKF
jgi:hypothetical protein